MNIELTAPGAPSAARGMSWLQAMQERIAKAYGMYQDERRRRATVRILQSLDSRILHDIGLARSEIDSVVHSRTDDRMQRYDTTWE